MLVKLLDKLFGCLQQIKGNKYLFHSIYHISKYFVAVPGPLAYLLNLNQAVGKKLSLFMGNRASVSLYISIFYTFYCPAVRWTFQKSKTTSNVSLENIFQKRCLFPSSTTTTPKHLNFLPGNTLSLDDMSQIVSKRPLGLVAGGCGHTTPF